MMCDTIVEGDGRRCQRCNSYYRTTGQVTAKCRQVNLNERPQQQQKCKSCAQREESINDRWPGAGTAVANLADRVAKNLRYGEWNILLEFSHGLGDDVQFCTVIRHLARLHPEFKLDVVGQERSHDMFKLAGARYCYSSRSEVLGQYNHDLRIAVADPVGGSREHPMTKAEMILERYFNIKPRPHLAGYYVSWRWRHSRAVRRWLKSIDVKPKEFVLMHYQGDSAKSRKNMWPEIAEGCVRRILATGYRVLIFDYGRRSPLVDDENVIRVDIPLDPSFTAALASLSRLNLGIDSGPGHVFGSRLVKTPAVIYWRKHHPYQFYQPADQVLHLLPRNHWHFIRGDEVDRKQALNYFHRHYRSHPVAGRPQKEIPEVIVEQLTTM